MKKVSRIIVFIIVGVILIATFRYIWESSRPEIPVYEIISPKNGNVQHTTTVTGNIEPRNKTAAKPELPGVVSRILKQAGQFVNEGEVIATLRVIPDAAQLNAADSRLRIADIAIEQLSKQYDRQRDLYEQDVISKNDFESMEATYQKAVEERENAENAVEIATKGYSRKSGLVDNTQVRSRISGTILDIPVKVGDRVIQSNPFNEGTTIAVVADMTNLIFKGTIDETEVGNIWKGMPLSISIGAIPNETIQAELEYIATTGKKENGTVLYEIKAAVKMPKSIFIRDNYSANAEILLNQVTNVITIPESSVEFNKNGSTNVYVLKDGNTKRQNFIKKQIEIGLSDGNNIEVKSGLSLNDQIRGMKIDTPNK